MAKKKKGDEMKRDVEPEEEVVPEQEPEVEEDLPQESDEVPSMFTDMGPSEVKVIESIKTVVINRAAFNTKAVADLTQHAKENGYSVVVFHGHPDNYLV